MKTTQQLQDTLEGLVDANGLSGVLDALAEICAAKAEHIETSWQDLDLSRDWLTMAQGLSTMAESSLV